MFEYFIVAGDVKVCFDTLNNAHESINWVVTDIISNISLFSSYFIYFSFNWVRMEVMGLYIYSLSMFPPSYLMPFVVITIFFLKRFVLIT